MTDAAPVGSLTHLRAGSTSVVIDSLDGQLPEVLYWGNDLGELSGIELHDLRLSGATPHGNSDIEVPLRMAVLPAPAQGWTGTPGITGSRSGRDFSPDFTVTGETPALTSATVATGRTYRAVDPVARLEVTITIELAPAGLLRMCAELTDTREKPQPAAAPDSAIDTDDATAPDQAADTDAFALQGLLLTLPLPAQAGKVLDFAGRHSRERIPQRSPVQVGLHVRESRQGKPGADGSHLMLAGENGFGFESGAVWGVHLGWSGNQHAQIERCSNGRTSIAAGELLLAGEVLLGAGERYRSPWLYAAHGDGLNQLAAQFHHYLRSRPSHPRRPRPIVVNTWEAVYFDQRIDRLLALAESAAVVGAERFVLDDGWFHGRRDDTAGLGDWWVDPDRWPNGLGALIEKVRGLGMDFGLWVEPEMVNLDSDLARAHPEWLMSTGGRRGLPSRGQFVLDLTHPAAYRHVIDQLLALLDTYDIAYLKWDHNRPVVEAGHQPWGRPAVHEQTRATYRMLAEIRSQHPELEIESCAAGGGRIDLGILEHTDRVWPSDCLDPLERQQIQRWTALLLPPELMGTHIGAERSHTTDRRHQLDFRAATAFSGSLGIEWDLAGLDQQTLHRVADWVALYRSYRELLHTGRSVVVDHPDPTIAISGVIAADQSEAIISVTTLARSICWPPGRVRVPGLASRRQYTPSILLATPQLLHTSWTPQWARTPVSLSGTLLAQAGIQLPAIHPETCILIHLRS